VSTATTPERRKLTFATLDEAVADAKNLLAKGYDRLGNWSLAQCCGHLACWLRYPVRGFPKMSLPVRMAFAVVRPLVGRKMLTKFLKDGMPAGTRTIPQSVPAPGGDDRAAVEEFEAAAAAFAAHPGEYLPSPLFGPLTRDEALTVQLRHAAHHLGFLVPKAA
jgi:hypothetical protein